MKKFLLIPFFLIGITGCGATNIIYDGVERPINEVEEILGDKLEVENPSLDINVNIYPE